MIKITILTKGELIYAIEATGHSGYSEAGSDIICSAVSTLTQNCAMGLKEMLNINILYTIEESKPYLYVELPTDLSESKLHDSQIILKSTYLGLKDLADSYPKYISIKEKRK